LYNANFCETDNLLQVGL